MGSYFRLRGCYLANPHLDGMQNRQRQSGHCGVSHCNSPEDKSQRGARFKPLWRHSGFFCDSSSGEDVRGYVISQIDQKLVDAFLIAPGNPRFAAQTMNEGWKASE